MAKTSILVVEDESDIQELVRYNLAKEGFQIAQARTGEDALRSASSQPPQLVLLDLMLPGIDGLSVCRQFKQNPRLHHIPIIMLTAKGEEADIVTGLELGADDYITKPFSPRVLTARVRAIIRRRAREGARDDETISVHGVAIHPGRHEVLLDGSPVDLTFSEFRLLHFLARRPGWVFTRYQIVDAIRGENYVVTERAVDVQIAGLRKKLGRHAELIQTVRGVGYRFRE